MDNLNEQNQSEMTQPSYSLNRIVNGKLYRVRIFFPEQCRETFQQKYERILRNMIISRLSEAPAPA